MIFRLAHTNILFKLNFSTVLPTKPKVTIPVEIIYGKPLQEPFLCRVNVGFPSAEYHWMYRAKGQPSFTNLPSKYMYYLKKSSTKSYQINFGLKQECRLFNRVIISKHAVYFGCLLEVKTI